MALLNSSSISRGARPVTRNAAESTATSRWSTTSALGLYGTITQPAATIDVATTASQRVKLPGRMVTSSKPGRHGFIWPATIRPSVSSRIHW